MSAMLEAYDMPMLEYPADIDVQMHASSSDQWIPEESHMEEDTPALHMKTDHSSSPKPDDHLQMKADVYPPEKSEVTIEVDMEPFLEHQNNEYEMQQDEPASLEAIPEAQDVEVYDVPLTQSPFMIPSLSVSQSISSNFSGHFDHAESSRHTINASLIGTHSPHVPQTETYDLDITPLDQAPTSVDVQHEGHDSHLDTHDVHDVSTEVPGVHEAHVVQLETHEPYNVLPDPDGHLNVIPGNGDIHLALPPEDHTQSEPSESSNISNQGALQEAVLDAYPHVLEEISSNQKNLPESSELLDELTADDERAGTLLLEPEPDTHEKGTNDANIQPVTDDHPSVNDPHEISEGVYIDPPPPVLLSVTSEDQFDFSFFNESPEWPSSHSAGAVFLRHLPTLYYEPLSAVFEALHEEEYLQSLFPLPENELVLEAVDLQFTISEDNVYTREVTLHDFNVLHDISGTNGLLRMRLYASAPRFIIRYQHLQDQVSRLNLEQPAIEPLSANVQSEINSDDYTDRQDQNHEALQPVNPSPERADGSHTALLLSSTEDQEGEGEENSTVMTETINPSDQGSSTSSQLLPENDGVGNDIEDVTEDVHDPESHLPPLPADHEEKEEREEGETNDEDHEDVGAGHENVGSELVLSEPIGSSELELPVEDQHQGITEIHQGEQGEEESYDDVEETHKLLDEDAGSEQNPAKNVDREDGESGGSESRNEDEAYVEDAVRPEDQDTTSHKTGDDIEYAQEEVDHALETESFDPSTEHFEYNHPSKQDHEGDSNLESEEEQLVVEDSGGGLDSGTSPSDAQNGTNSSTELDNYVNLEDGTEHESENVWESLIDHTGQETYDWEETLDDEEHDTQWDRQDERLTTNSSHSSVTLSSKTSKRSFDELEIDDQIEDEGGHWSPPSSPDPKRSRIQ